MKFLLSGYMNFKENDISSLLSLGDSLIQCHSTYPCKRKCMHHGFLPTYSLFEQHNFISATILYQSLLFRVLECPSLFFRYLGPSLSRFLWASSEILKIIFIGFHSRNNFCKLVSTKPLELHEKILELQSFGFSSKHLCCRMSAKATMEAQISFCNIISNYV